MRNVKSPRKLPSDWGRRHRERPARVNTRFVEVGLAIVAASFLVALSATAQELRLPKVEVEEAPQTDFSQFKTYAWKASQEEAPEHSTHATLVWHIERGLEKKGLVKAADSAADVLVRYYWEDFDKKVRGIPSQSEGPAGDTRTNVTIDRVKTGTLVLELSRRDTEGFVWRASTPCQVPDKLHVEDEVISTVGRLLLKYPPLIAEASPAPRD